MVTQLVQNQRKALEAIRRQGLIDDFRHME